MRSRRVVAAEAGYEADAGPGIAWSGVSDKRSYYRLFAGYVAALLATGVATVALALVAFDLAGEDSGAVIGTALSLKMAGYVLVAPLLTALLHRLPRKAAMITLDLIRAVSLGLLAFVTEVWQLYALVFAFTAASATFSLTYMAAVPYLLGSEEDYTRSLARSRIASELEGPLSPMVAAALLLLLSPRAAIIVTALAFLGSALLVGAARLPAAANARSVGIGLYDRLRRGPRLFLSVPAFRALVAMDVAVALASAMVMVNTVVLVQGKFDLDRDAVALAFGIFGLGAVLGAAILPLLHARVDDRSIMLAGGVVLFGCLLAGTLQTWLPALLTLWLGLGFSGAIALTPATYLIRRLARPADLQMLIAAQMSLANGLLLLAYPLAGWLGATLGMAQTFAILGLLAALAVMAFARLWPAGYAPEP
ncbi:MFS transporter [Paracoccus sp. (in: a-proteobacteria)]|uniref:MFS transporter n=1 Tax=Paracoccus sp. TaxID=267 RepID=UPI00321FDE73